LLTIDTFIRKNDRVPYRIIEGEAILVNVKSGEVIHLNEVGAAIWSFLEAEKKISQVVNHICENFEIDEKTTREDTLEFIQSLLDNGLVVCDG